MTIQIGQHIIEAKIDPIALEDFNAKHSSEILCTILEQVMNEFLHQEMRDRIKAEDHVGSMKVESYLSALEDVCELIRVHIPTSLRDNR